MTGNCFGWLVYAYYSRDPFVLASNIPGIMVSIWLNSGASKLQYYNYMEVGSRIESNNGNDSSTERLVLFTPQDKLMLGVLSSWTAIIVCVGWLGIGYGHEKEIIGIIVNINLMFFYGSPLQTLKTVIVEKSSNSIHTPTMVLNCANAGFWAAYGIAISNPVIYGPNCIGFFLGLSQATLCCMYPKNCNPRETGLDDTPLLDSREDASEADVDSDTGVHTGDADETSHRVM